jgi:amino-acid N-acetyltransferase
MRVWCVSLPCCSCGLSGRGAGQSVAGCGVSKARQLHLKTLFVLSTQTMHWFIERGFLLSEFNNLPEPLKVLYNPQRNSKILCKHLE